MASKTGASPTAKHRIESLKKAKNDLSTHHSYVISMSMKSVKQSPKMSREAQPQQATQTAQMPAETKDGDSQKNDNQKGESWFGIEDEIEGGRETMDNGWAVLLSPSSDRSLFT